MFIYICSSSCWFLQGFPLETGTCRCIVAANMDRWVGRDQLTSASRDDERQRKPVIGNLLGRDHRTRGPGEITDHTSFSYVSISGRLDVCFNVFLRANIWWCSSVAPAARGNEPRPPTWEARGGGPLLAGRMATTPSVGPRVRWRFHRRRSRLGWDRSFSEGRHSPRLGSRTGDTCACHGVEGRGVRAVSWVVTYVDVTTVGSLS